MEQSQARKPYLSTIPVELLDIKQWLAWRPEQDKSRMKKIVLPGYKYKQLTSLKTFGQLPLDGETVFPGFVLHEGDTYIVFDIDFFKKHPAAVKHTPFSEQAYKELLGLLPQWLSTYFQKNETFIEWSPSGLGIHAFYKLENPGIKSRMRPRLTWRDANDDKLVLGEVFTKSSWLTFTGKPVPGSVNVVHRIPFTENDLLFKNIPGLELKKSNLREVPKFQDPTQTSFVVNVDDVKKALSQIPCDREHKRVQEAYTRFTKKPFDYYDFWTLVLRSVKFLADTVDPNTRETLTRMVFNWSNTDPDPNMHMEPEEFLTKFDSFKADDKAGAAITQRTLFGLAKAMKFNFPHCQMKEKDGKIIIGKPYQNSPANFKALLKYWDVKVHLAEHGSGLVIKMHPFIQKRFFNQFPVLQGFIGPVDPARLEVSINELFEYEGYTNWSVGSTRNILRSYIASLPNLNRDPKSLISLWLETPEAELPEDWHANPDADLDTIDDVLDCIEFDVFKNDTETVKHYRNLMRKWFSQVYLFTKYKGDYVDRPGMLILVGPQNAYKTTFSRMLLPSRARQVYDHLFANVPLDIGKVTNDTIDPIANSFVSLFDEIDHIVKQSLETIKSYITSPYFTRRILTTHITQRVEIKTLMIGTTNTMKFKMPKGENRRFWFIKVKQIDTNRMRRINWWRVYNNLNKECETYIQKTGKLPWALTHEDREYLTFNQAEHRLARNPVEKVLRLLHPVEKIIESNNLKEAVGIGSLAYVSGKGVHPKLLSLDGCTSFRNYLDGTQMFGAKNIDGESFLSIIQDISKTYTNTAVTPERVLKKPKGIINRGFLCMEPGRTKSLLLPPPDKEMYQTYNLDQAYKELWEAAYGPLNEDTEGGDASE